MPGTVVGTGDLRMKIWFLSLWISHNPAMNNTVVNNLESKVVSALMGKGIEKDKNICHVLLSAGHCVRS